MKKLMLMILTAALLAGLTSFALAAADKGQGVYMNFCAACHDSGIAGAPKVGDAADWQKRAEKGTQALIDNAIKGYQGSTGYMPAKGGHSALSDEEVTAAVKYMLSQSQ
jgi:cytochrome c5